MEMGKDSGSTSLPAGHRFSDELVSEEGCLDILLHFLFDKQKEQTLGANG